VTERIESLRRAVEYGQANGKRNLVVDLDVLAELLAVKPADAVRRRWRILHNAFQSRCSCSESGNAEHTRQCQSGALLYKACLMELGWFLRLQPEIDEQTDQLEAVQTAEVEISIPITVTW